MTRHVQIHAPLPNLSLQSRTFCHTGQQYSEGLLVLALSVDCLPVVVIHPAAPECLGTHPALPHLLQALLTAGWQSAT
jgi:hypothetical protein